MGKKMHGKLTRSVLLVLVAVTILIGVLAIPQTQAYGYKASYIDMLGDMFNTNYQNYLDGSVVFKLPSTIKEDDQISVIITLDVENLLDAYHKTDGTKSFAEYASGDSGAAIEKKISTRKAEILKVLDEKSVSYTVGEDYSVLLSGFELVITAKDFAATCKTLGKGENVIISEEYHVAETQLVENTVNVYTGTGIFDSSSSGYDGSGVVVAVLDTGLDSNHSAFSVNNFTSKNLGLTYKDVASVLNNTEAYSLSGGLTVDDVYINEKVPFAYDYADKDPDVYSTHNNHGTHVSGIIVGKDSTITGVAPNAQLVSMKTFSDVSDTAMSSWILAALEDCVVLGVDVINMSLGTACGFSRESDEEVLNGVYDKIRAAGISMVVAASNSYSSAYGSDANGNLGLTSNPDTGTVGSPSTYEGVLSVGSINGVETPYLKHGDSIIYFDESNSGAGIENHFVDTLLTSGDSADFEYVVIPGVGRTADYTGLDVKGKIALVRRGDTTFEEKAMVAEAQGAAGIIIYNNISGDIKMNVGDAKLAVCSISQNDGEMLAAAGNGKLTVSKSQTSGPFISDFSSWGPTPSLGIKPEIIAHGGNILSSVTGGGYDRLSGTSMACPNMSGVVLLMRQYVKENFPEIAGDNIKITQMVYKLLMSTADIALNTNGQPYAVRKQGAGLANLMNAIGTTAYITTYDKNGNGMDKTKLELGDDPDKKGVYTLSFTVNNFGGTSLTYDIGAYVMTEGVSETLTNAGETTVTEEAYILSGASVAVSCTSGGTMNGTKLTVAAGQNADVTVTITLSDEDKEYLNNSFANGMYVEGFVTLDAVSGTKIDLSVPYLAFYGDWTVAPLFDLTYYETNADELDTGIDEEDKLKPDAYATRAVGGISDDYVSYLGSYYFMQDPKDMVISANEDYIALSNQEGTVHSLRFVWAGLLRNAAKIEIKITNDATGEVVFETVDTDVRKSYGDGGSIYPANIEIEFDTMDYNFANNSQFTVTLTGYLDYGDGGLTTNEKNVYSFPLTVDFQAPTVTDVEYYYEYDKTLKKNRLYAKVSIYDNHYTMASQLGYVAMGEDENGEPLAEVVTFEQYMTPVYSERNSTTVVTFELTDYLYKIKEGAYNANAFSLTCYDYALNYATYEIGLPDNYIDFYFDGLDDGLTLSPNEVFSLEPLVYPYSEWAELLEFSSSKPSVVRVVNNKLVAGSSGNAIVKARDPKTGKSVSFTVKVLAEGEEGYRRYDKPVADVFTLDGYYTNKAYFMLSNDEKLIGDTGNTRFFEGNFSLSLYPSESVTLNYTLDAYFPNDTTVEFESSNSSIVTIDANGTLTAQAEGFASVTIKVIQDGRSTYYSETVSIEVKDPYVANGGILTHYYGLGGIVTIPERLSLREIGSFAFSNFDYVLKSEEELALDDREATKQWYIGDSTITKVVIPEGVKKINAYAFANLTALEEIVLPSTLEAIEYGAFFGCSSLTKITFSGENNLVIINQNAFEGCDLRGTIDLSAACVISDHAFAGNRNLEGVTTSKSLLSIGSYAFAGCEKLKTVTITADKVKYGTYAFTGCKALTSFYVNASVLPEGMFYQCTDMKSVSIGPDVNEIGEFAFRETGIGSFEIKSGNKAYKVQSADYILSADGKRLMAVAPVIKGAFTDANIGGSAVTVVGWGAFSHNTAITSVTLPNVTMVEGYGFGSSEGITSVSLGDLQSIGEYAFFETAITKLPAFTAETAIGKYAFAFTKVTSVTIPDNMVVEEGVFSNNFHLKEIVVGNNVTLGDYAFYVDKNESFNILNYSENGTKYFYYEFYSALKDLTIGENCVMGKSAFNGHASLERVTLGAGAQIGEMAFYNCSSLKTIDLSKAKSVGNYAFSGDVFNICVDENMSVAAVGNGQYLYSYHATMLDKADLSSAESVGEYAFAYCLQLEEVVLGEKVTEIPQYAFSSCSKLSKIDLSGVVTIGDYAFMETQVLETVDLSSAESVGKYAFVNGKALENLTLNPEGVDLGEGAFCYCELLTEVGNLSAVRNVGDYAFAYTGIIEADLTGAISIGTHAFMKEELTPFKVTLGQNLKSLGDNPFAMCIIEPFYVTEVETFNGVDYPTNVYTYNISDTVFVIDGSLYATVPSGLELITYTDLDGSNVHVADKTVRITALAFAGSRIQRVTLPYTVASIGHQAFYLCYDLDYVVFTSYEAPILEEEFDPAYYESYEHIPGAGDYGTYPDYDGNEVQINGAGIIPYYMWGVTNGMYSNVFYGANFVDYVGYVDDKLIMVRPVNGEQYASYIYCQYFDLTIDGAAAADDITLAAIAAIDRIPEKVVYEDKAIVEAAREAYNKIATYEQKALVHNYEKLLSAEQRILALTPVVEDPAPQKNTFTVPALSFVCLVLAALCGAAIFVLKKLQKRKETGVKVIEEVTVDEIVEVQQTEDASEEAVQTVETENTDETAEIQ